MRTTDLEPRNYYLMILLLLVVLFASIFVTSKKLSRNGKIQYLPSLFLERGIGPEAPGGPRG